MIIYFGKYKGKTLSELKKDEHYCNWLKKTPGYEDFVSKHLNTENITIMEDLVIYFGKYKGKTLSELKKDEHYCNWLKKTPGYEDFVSKHLNTENITINKEA